MAGFHHWTWVVLLVISAPTLAVEPVRVANEGDIKQAWTLPAGVHLAAPVYPPQFVERGLEVCIAVGYLLNPDGSTSDFAMLKGWNSESGTREPADGFWAAFAEAGAAAVQQWRFQPRPEVERPVPVYTVATMMFGKKGATLSPELRRHCTIPSLARHLADLRGDKKARRLLDTELFDRMRLEQEDF